MNFTLTNESIGFPQNRVFRIIFLLIIVWNLNLKCCAQDGELKIIQTDSIVLEVARIIEEKYVFKDIGARIAQQLTKNNKLGVYRHITSMENLVNSIQVTILDISKDNHFDLSVIRTNSHHNNNELPAFSEHGFKKAELIQDSIAYFELDHLPGSDNDLEFAEHMMMDHSACNAIVFDVRTNAGGSGDLVELLCSYLFKESFILYRFFGRESQVMYEASITPPDAIEVAHFSEIPIYVLIGPNTTSAGESLAYILKHFNRATIVGEVSVGMAHPSQRFNIQDLVYLTIPFIRFEHPNTGTDWEGVGVIPDIKVKTDLALNAALDDLKSK